MNTQCCVCVCVFVPVGDGEHGSLHDALHVPALRRAGHHHDHALRAVSGRGADQAEADRQGARARWCVWMILLLSRKWDLGECGETWNDGGYIVGNVE